MFFCEKCRSERNWPGLFVSSVGTCEVCGAVSECFDVASKHLPLPPKSATSVEDARPNLEGILK